MEGSVPVKDTDQFHLERIEAAARAGRRAPTRKEVPISAIRRLEAYGAIQRHKDDNTVEILIGPHAGKRTAAIGPR